MEKISVAIATYNGERFIEKQLDSILKQLEPQDEIVISYDKSSDNTWEIINSYANKNPQIKVIENNISGIATNFNNALVNCSGEYIFICDQDDIWADNKRSKVIEKFRSTKADMVIHNGVHIDINDKTISKPFFSIYRIGDGKLKNLLKPRYSGCCTAFTKQMAEKILPIPSKIDAYDHWVGTIGEFMGKIAYEPEILLYHRLHGENVTTPSSRSIFVILKARLGLLKELSKRKNRERKNYAK